MEKTITATSARITTGATHLRLRGGSAYATKGGSGAPAGSDIGGSGEANADEGATGFAWN
jgi:hypothetical protein